MASFLGLDEPEDVMKFKSKRYGSPLSDVGGRVSD